MASATRRRTIQEPKRTTTLPPTTTILQGGCHLNPMKPERRQGRQHFNWTSAIHQSIEDQRLLLAIRMAYNVEITFEVWLIVVTRRINRARLSSQHKALSINKQINKPFNLSIKQSQAIAIVRTDYTSHGTRYPQTPQKLQKISFRSA